jgi:diketogulonate reductase-like aldo/keto reductase
MVATSLKNQLMPTVRPQRSGFSTFATFGSTVLKYRQLGATELQVPVISLGSWLTYSGGIEKRQAMTCVHKALDLGINLFDTANVYGRGAAESVLGEALAGIGARGYER